MPVRTHKRYKQIKLFDRCNYAYCGCLGVYHMLTHGGECNFTGTKANPITWSLELWSEPGKL